MGQKKKVAALMFTYFPHSHADVIIGRILHGYRMNGTHYDPQIQVVSMYVEQTHKEDLSKGLAEQFKIPMFSNIEQALTQGEKKLQVEGVVFVGEHGDFPSNEKGQHLYPRYRVFKEIVEVFKKTGQTVPVFSDKHLSVDWKEAKWMVDQSVKMKFPFMAGSSLPLWWRNPPLELEYGTPLEKAVVIHNGPVESYGFHGLEALQCIAERRLGGETGIVSVQGLKGLAVWEWTDQNPWAKELLDQTLDLIPNKKKEDVRINVKDPVCFIVEYKDGLLGTVYNLNGHAGGWTFSGQIKGEKNPFTFKFQSGEDERPHAHFAPLAYHIERMIVTGKPSYPVQRTLLTTGALSFLCQSMYENGKKIKTPQLKIKYKGQKESLFWR